MLKYDYFQSQRKRTKQTFHGDWGFPSWTQNSIWLYLNLLLCYYSVKELSLIPTVKKKKISIQEDSNPYPQRFVLPQESQPNSHTNSIPAAEDGGHNLQETGHSSPIHFPKSEFFSKRQLSKTIPFGASSLGPSSLYISEK